VLPLLKDYEMISGLGNMFDDTMALGEKKEDAR
jgi:hypothetical protein